MTVEKKDTLERAAGLDWSRDLSGKSGNLLLEQMTTEQKELAAAKHVLVEAQSSAREAHVASAAANRRESVAEGNLDRHKARITLLMKGL